MTMAASTTNAAEASPLRWWTAPQLNALAEGLDAPWRQWLDDWGLAPQHGVAVQCVLAHETPGQRTLQWEPIGARADAVAWIAAGPQGGRAAMYRALFGNPGQALELPISGIAGAMAGEVAGAAWCAALHCLAQALMLDGPAGLAPPPPFLWLRWSGAVVASLPLHGNGVHALLDAQTVQAWLGARGGALATNTIARAGSTASLQSVALAMAANVLPVRAELDGCEIALGALQELRVGDVVRLSHALDAPLRMAGPGQEHLGAGWLGQRAGVKAVELMRRPEAAVAA